MRRGTKRAEQRPAAPGAFLSDGSYAEHGEMHHRGHVDGLVRSLVRSRRAGRVSLAEAARVVEAANATLAFPSFSAWAETAEACGELPAWPLARLQTSAEAVVAHAGHNPASGHWCGDAFLPTPERECGDERHRKVSPPAALSTLIESLSGALSSELIEPPPMR